MIKPFILFFLLIVNLSICEGASLCIESQLNGQSQQEINVERNYNGLATGQGYTLSFEVTNVTAQVDVLLDDGNSLQSISVGQTGNYAFHLQPAGTTAVLLIQSTSGKKQSRSICLDNLHLESVTQQTTTMTYKEPVNDYRYAFNGEEKDDDWKGLGNSYDYGARMHDPRLGRWLSIDPLAEDYPMFSTYHFTANSPIMMIDEEGKDIWLSYRGIKFRYDGQNLIPSPNNSGEVSEEAMAWFEATKTQLNQLKEDDILAKSVIKFLETHKAKTMIRKSSKNYTMFVSLDEESKFYSYYNASVIIDYNPFEEVTSDKSTQEGKSIEGEWNERKPRVGLADELWHARSYISESVDELYLDISETIYGDKLEDKKLQKEEVDALNFSNRIRLITGDPIRTGYGGGRIPEEYLKTEEELKAPKVLSEDGKTVIDP
ncbi:MAG: RHS repeat domain-containing protein [Salibacteraceae bacterium]